MFRIQDIFFNYLRNNKKKKKKRQEGPLSRAEKEIFKDFFVYSK